MELYTKILTNARRNKGKKPNQPGKDHSLEEQLPGRIWEVLCPKVFQLPFKTLSIAFPISKSLSLQSLCPLKLSPKALAI